MLMCGSMMLFCLKIEFFLKFYSFLFDHNCVHLEEIHSWCFPFFPIFIHYTLAMRYQYFLLIGGFVSNLALKSPIKMVTSF